MGRDDCPEPTGQPWSFNLCSSTTREGLGVRGGIETAVKAMVMSVPWSVKWFNPPPEPGRSFV